MPVEHKLLCFDRWWRKNGVSLVSLFYPEGTVLGFQVREKEKEMVSWPFASLKGGESASSARGFTQKR